MTVDGQSLEEWSSQFDRRTFEGILDALTRIADALDVLVQDKRTANLPDSKELLAIEEIKRLIPVHHVYRDAFARCVFENQSKSPKEIFSIAVRMGFCSKSTYWKDIKVLAFISSVAKHSKNNGTNGGVSNEPSNS